MSWLLDRIKWAESVLSYCTSSFYIVALFPAAESAILAYAMLGRSEKMEELISHMSNQLEKLRSPLQQAWALYSADALAMLGKYREAEELGWRATEGDNEKLHLDFCVGPFARSIARSALHRGSASAARRRLADLMLDLDSYDAIDKAEILNAASYLSSRTGDTLNGAERGMWNCLNDLPDAIREQLERMGMLKSFSFS